MMLNYILKCEPYADDEQDRKYSVEERWGEDNAGASRRLFQLYTDCELKYDRLLVEVSENKFVRVTEWCCFKDYTYLLDDDIIAEIHYEDGWEECLMYKEILDVAMNAYNEDVKNINGECGH